MAQYHGMVNLRHINKGNIYGNFKDIKPKICHIDGLAYNPMNILKFIKLAVSLQKKKEKKNQNIR